MSVVNFAIMVSMPGTAAQLHVRNFEFEVRFGFVAGGFRDLLPQFFRRTDQPEEQLRDSAIGNHVGRAAAFDLSDVHGAWTGLGILGQLQLANVLQRIQQLLDCRLAQLGIGRVRHACRVATNSTRSVPFDASANRFSVGSPLIRNFMPRGC